MVDRPYRTRLSRLIRADRTRRLAPVVTLVLVAASSAPAAAGAAVSHATNWSTPGEEVLCGIAEVPGTRLDPGTGAPQNGLWPGLQCSAQGIPRPTRGIGDPFVQLGRGSAGRARLIDESQDDLISNGPFRTLKAGSVWKRDGIGCVIHRASIRCTNSVGHGFTMSTGHVHLS